MNQKEYERELSLIKQEQEIHKQRYKNKIIFALCIYNDKKVLEKCLHTWLPHIDEIIVVDSCHSDFPSVDDYSTDGSVEYLQDVCANFHLNCIPHPIPVHVIRPSQRIYHKDQRSLYMKWMDEHGDWEHTWLFPWDSDMAIPEDDKNVFELLKLGQWDEYKIIYMKIDLWGNDAPYPSEWPAAYRNTPHCRYLTNHYTITNTETGENINPNLKYPQWHFESVVMLHKFLSRPYNRQCLQERYYKSTRKVN